ncbi:MAG TPA: tRNA guanosine(34) transglycosylase Tgt [Candidatus Acidoferrales bacterium]|nr:tRNA guanosine(34) transglycosylase Tgt [Candidatus Acidoferrales bacterium]
MAFRFEVLKTDPTGARLGRLETPHGVFDTPAFLPIGTAGTVKGISQDQLEALGAQIVLANTYHLYLRPGHERIRSLGGLHAFMSWPHPILTDSGGYQVFSLAELRKVTDEGVTFRSHLDGTEHFFPPERALEVELALGADLIMVLDECIALPAEEAATRAAARRTLEWARRSREYFGAHGDPRRQMLFAIVQGGACAAIRRENAEELAALDFPGYAIGGLAVGEAHETTCGMTEEVTKILPGEKPRYLMGVGKAEDIADYVMRGVDFMDCVLPTRNARNGWLYTSHGRVVIRSARYAEDLRPPDGACQCPVCRRYTRAYLRHLFVCGEMLGPILNSIHNVHFYLERMRGIRAAIAEGTLAVRAAQWRQQAGAEEQPADPREEAEGA